MPPSFKDDSQYDAWTAPFLVRNQDHEEEAGAETARSVVVIKRSPHLLIIVASRGHRGHGNLSSEPNANRPAG